MIIIDHLELTKLMYNSHFVNLMVHLRYNLINQFHVETDQEMNLFEMKFQEDRFLALIPQLKI